jgi:group I intron endonuclease
MKTILKKKYGVYYWHNNINGNIYIGSAVNLWNRLLDYNQSAYIIAKSQTLIVKALSKYCIQSFDNIILEFANVTEVRAVEQ